MQEEISRLAFRLKRPKKEIEQAYKVYWQFIKDTLEKQPLDKVETEEDFDKLNTSVNIKNFGKIACTFKRCDAINKKQKDYDKHQEDQSNC